MYTFDVVDLVHTLPECALLVGTLMLLAVFIWKKEASAPLLLSTASAYLGVILVLVLCEKGSGGTLWNGMLVVNGFTQFVKSLIVLGAMLCLFMAIGFYRRYHLYLQGEFALIVLFAVLGMLLMVSAHDLMALYVGMELQSLALYILAAMHRQSLKSTEAGLKYFVLGALSSGMFLYGCSLIYGFSGTTQFSVLATLYAQGNSMPLGALVGLVCIIAGLCFKIAAVPFHMWAPDVYEGAPLPVTTFFAVAPKVAAVAVFIRLVMVPFAGIVTEWQQVIMFVSAISMVIGALGAMRQVNIKRLMAYSSIGHIGYVLIGLATGSHEGIQAILVYLFVYITMTLGMFACIMMVKSKDHINEDIYALAGLAKTRPLMAVTIAILMFSMAGIPPFAGFFGKFFIFLAAIKQGMYTLAVIGVLSSVLAAFYYIRIIKIMYFDEATVSFDKDVDIEMRLVAGTAAILNLLFFAVFTPLLLLAGTVAQAF